MIHVTKERVTGPKPDQGRKSQEATIGVTREPVTRLLSEFRSGNYYRAALENLTVAS